MRHEAPQRVAAPAHQRGERAMAVAVHGCQNVVGALGKPVEFGVQISGNLGHQAVELRPPIGCLEVADLVPKRGFHLTRTDR